MKKVLAVIPARGGSKSILQKNVKLFNGFPLIAYSIAAGLHSKLVNRVIVSTDDQEIARIARDFGAEVPFMRPSKLALDDTPDLPVFQHALKWLKEHENYKPDIIVQLRPTSPFRPEGMVDEAIGLLQNKNADSVRTVVPVRQNPYKMWDLKKNGFMVPILKLGGFPEPYNMPRQKLPESFWQTGHVDVIRATIVNRGSMSGKNILPLIIDQAFTVDIDTQQDWDRAEWLLKTSDLNIIRTELK